MKEKIDNIPEIKHYLSKFILYAIFMILAIVGFIVFVLLDEDFVVDDWVILLYLLAFFSPFVAYYLTKVIYYFRLKPTHIQEAQIEKLESKWTTYMAFKVEMNFFGRIEEIDTLRIFKPRPMGFNRIDDYLHKKVLVGYDEGKKKAIILKLID